MAKTSKSENNVVIEITSQPMNARSIVQELLEVLRGKGDQPTTREMDLAIARLEEASFWLATSYFDGTLPNVERINRKRAEEVAQKVVEHLFLDNSGDKRPINRLVIEYGGQDLKNAGWGRESVRDAIVKYILQK